MKGIEIQRNIRICAGLVVGISTERAWGVENHHRTINSLCVLSTGASRYNYRQRKQSKAVQIGVSLGHQHALGLLFSPSLNLDR